MQPFQRRVVINPKHHYMPKLQLTLSTLLVFLFFYSEAQDELPEQKSYTTAWVTGEVPVIDGRLDDPAWDQVEWGGDFVGHQPNYMAEPSQDTKFKILYDDKFLYVGIRAYDTNPDEIVQRMSRRDGFDGDWVELNIDSYNDKRTAFSFTASVSGVKGDEYVSNNGDDWDDTWDPIWFLETSVDDEGWIAEYKIPLSQLRFANQPTHRWGIQLTRRFFREQERWTWQPIDPNAPGWVHLFGELNGIAGIKPQKQLEILPYVVGTTSRFPAEEGNPYRETGRDQTGNAGVDAKIGITSDITLDLSVNPDFGQVNADPSMVNLSAFQLFFREQRPFFLEGANVLDFSTSMNRNNLYYSRRIGAPPRGTVPDDIEYEDRPTNTRILGAAKLTGKNANGFSWAVMDALTARTVEDVTDFDGNERTEVIDPLTNYTIGRFQQDIDGGKTVFGAIVSNVNRYDNRINGLDLLHDNAQSAGVDLNHFFQDRKYGTTMKFGMSRVEGTPGAIYQTQTSFERNFQRTNNDYRSVDSTRTELVGSFGSLSFGKRSGQWRWEMGSNYRSPGLELNDIGFLRQTDNINNWAWTRYNVNDETTLFRQQFYRFYHEQNYDFGGTRTSLGTDLYMGLQFHNFWWLEQGFFVEGNQVLNADLRGGPSLTVPGGINYWYWIGTNEQKKVRVTFNNWYYWGNEDYYEAMGLNWNFIFRPLDALNVTISPRYSQTNNSLQYIYNENEGDGIYMLALIKQKTYSMAIRANYNLTPNLTIEYWGQPFISSGKYSDYKRVTDSNNPALDNRYNLVTDEELVFTDNIYTVNESGGDNYSFENPDFNIVQFRSNLVMRWEYVPGSVVFLAWSNNGSFFDQDRPGFNRLGSELGNLRGTNTFLIKYTYRFVL
jgi:hypothetical protein